MFFFIKVSFLFYFLYVSNRHFRFFAKQNIKFCFRMKDSVWIGYSNILSKLAANPFVWRNKNLELLTLSFKD